MKIKNCSNTPLYINLVEPGTRDIALQSSLEIPSFDSVIFQAEGISVIATEEKSCADFN